MIEDLFKITYYAGMVVLFEEVQQFTLFKISEICG